MDSLYDNCINALSEYCIYLIKQKRFFHARMIVNAIESVINTQLLSDEQVGGAPTPLSSISDKVRERR